MVEAAPPPPKKPAGPMRFILLGCGVLTGLVLLGLGSCAGVMYFVYKGTDSVAAVGAEYLRHSELGQAGGLRIERRPFEWNVNVQNDRGNARIGYTVKSGAGAPIGEAVVWLVRTAGKWEAIGARVKRPSLDDLTIGTPPKEHHRIDWND